jgi:DNA-binding transcriptional MerR regulator
VSPLTQAEEIEQMRIGELAQRTGTSRRLLRYYEDQGLISPTRSPNGYRDYDERYVDRVVQIRALLDVGLPTRVIKTLLRAASTCRTRRRRRSARSSASATG